NSEAGKKRVRHTSHQLNDMRACLYEDCLGLFRIIFFKLALQISAPVLILAKFIELALVVLERDVVETRLVSTVQTTPAASSLEIVFAVLPVHAILPKIALILILISLKLTVQSHLSGHLVGIIRMHGVCIHLGAIAIRH